MRRRVIPFVLAVAATALSGLPAHAQLKPLKPVEVTASAAESKAAGGHDDYLPEKTIDGDLKPASSWRAQVTDAQAGQWIQYVLGGLHKVAAVQLAFVKGDERVYRFVIELSIDGRTWATAFTGASAGKTADFETFTLADPATACYVRVRGFGNDSKQFGDWFNITETQILEAVKSRP